MIITKDNLVKWIREVIKDHEGFDTYDPDPENQKAKEMIKQAVRELRGRVD